MKSGVKKNTVSRYGDRFTPSDLPTEDDYGATFYLATTNIAGSATSDKVTLTRSETTAAPWIKRHPTAKGLIAGESATFTVEAFGTPAPTFQWQKNGVNIPGAVAARYTTPAINADDNGAAFGVVVSNRDGSVISHIAKLTVGGQAAPMIVTQPQKARVFADQCATFTIEAKGAPAPTFQWQKNGIDIPGATAATYTTPAAASGDNSTVYRVVVTNPAGNIYSDAVRLTVNSPSAPAPGTHPQSRIPVILDSAISADIDDTGDLVMVLKSPRLDLKLITTTSFNAVERARRHAKLLTIAGRSDVPIGLGDQRVTFRNGVGSQSAWLKGYQLSDYKGKVHQDGVQAMIDTINNSPVPVTIIANSPFQTIAAALRKDPGIAPKVNLVGMMGSIRHPKISIEGNIKADIPAAQLVFTAPWRSMAIAPADTANFVYCDGWGKDGHFPRRKRDRCRPHI